LSNPASVPLSQIVGRVSERNREHIDRVLTVSAQHGLVKQESFFTKRVAAKNLSSYLVVRQGTFVYNKSYSAAAPFGVATYNKTVEPGVISPLYFTFRPNPELVLDEYLEYVLNSNTFHQQMARYIKEGGRAHGGINVSVDDYLSVEVLLPTLQEQRRVVDLIAAVDSYLAALQQQADAARSARSAVLNDLLSAGGDDWTETLLGDVAEILDRMRKPISGAEREKRMGNIPYYGATGQAGWIDKPMFDEELVLLGEDAIDFLNPDVHKAYLISGPSWVNNHAHVLRANGERVLSFFLMEALNAVDYSQFVAFGTRSKLTQGAMMQISIQIPPLTEQHRIVKIISSMDDVIQSADKAVADAKNLRSGLLSELLSGAHEIPESYDRLLGAA